MSGVEEGRSRSPSARRRRDVRPPSHPLVRPAPSSRRFPGRPSTTSETVETPPRPEAGRYVASCLGLPKPSAATTAAQPAWVVQLDQLHFKLQSERVAVGLPASPVCTILGTQGPSQPEVKLCAHYNAGVPCPSDCRGGESHRCNLAIPAFGKTKGGAQKMRACGGFHARCLTHETWGGDDASARIRVRDNLYMT